MTYKIEHSIETFGKQKLYDLIHTEGITLVELHKVLNLSNSDKRLHAGVYKRIFEYLSIKGLPYDSDKKEIRKLKLEFDRVGGNYWESEYIVGLLLDRLDSPVMNYSNGIKRFVINFPKHPKANKNSNQVKAHIVSWELVNEQYVPEDCWVIPLDENYTNLDLCNWILVNTKTYKNKLFSGINNPSYKHGLALRPKHGGWSKLSKEFIYKNPYCTICRNDKDLVVHHIISYHLFNTDYISANSNYNLMTLCRSCHSKVHSNNTNIKAHIEETQYSKLLELLETLKSQVPESLMETYKDVEKQLGLTDNQQPSTA